MMIITHKATQDDERRPCDIAASFEEALELIDARKVAGVFEIWGRDDYGNFDLKGRREHAGSARK